MKGSMRHAGWGTGARVKSLFAGLTGILFLGVVFPAAGEVVERVGYAYQADDGDLLYTEEHREWKEDGTITRSTVTYRNPDGTVIAIKTLDFLSDPVSPEFRLSNSANGHMEGARQEPDHFVVFFRKSHDHDYKEIEVDPPGNAIIDGGFDRFIEENWNSLLNGEVFKRPFLVPSFHKFIDFKIYLEKENEDNVVFVMEPASLILRIVGDRILVSYDRRTAALRLYEGISNIRDAAGENYEVRVEFPNPRQETAQKPIDTKQSYEPGRTNTRLEVSM